MTHQPAIHFIRRRGLFLVAALLAVPVLAGPGHHPGITGPNGGRMVHEVEPHLEFFVTAERKARLTFVDDAGRTGAVPAGWSATLVTGE